MEKGTMVQLAVVGIAAAAIWMWWSKYGQSVSESMAPLGVVTTTIPKMITSWTQSSPTPYNDWTTPLTTDIQPMFGEYSNAVSSFVSFNPVTSILAYNYNFFRGMGIIQ